MRNLLFIIFTFIVININAQKEFPIYSFFSAGHTYGSPDDPPHLGLHYPFVDYIPTINSFINMEFGVLTGDVVRTPTSENWDSAENDINSINYPIYISAGNHDMGSEFINRFENYYFSFYNHGDLFIILTPGLDAWNITGDQLDFLTNTLNNNNSTENNIFIFMHELIWWSPDNIYKNVKINWVPHYPGSTNFDSVVKPLLLSFPNNITIYAGDLGCTNNVSPVMYHNFDNITLIASGMGGGIRDNIIVTNVYSNNIYYDLVAINGNNPNSLGEITDFSVTKTPSIETSNIKVFPNPCSDFFNIKNNKPYNINIRIFNNNSKLVYTNSIKNNSNAKINISNLNSGIYFLEINTLNSNIIKKLIVNK